MGIPRGIFRSTCNRLQAPVSNLKVHQDDVEDWAEEELPLFEDTQRSEPEGERSRVWPWLGAGAGFMDRLDAGGNCSQVREGRWSRWKRLQGLRWCSPPCTYRKSCWTTLACWCLGGGTSPSCSSFTHLIASCSSQMWSRSRRQRACEAPRTCWSPPHTYIDDSQLQAEWPRRLGGPQVTLGQVQVNVAVEKTQSPPSSSLPASRPPRRKRLLLYATKVWSCRLPGPPTVGSCSQHPVP